MGSKGALRPASHASPVSPASRRVSTPPRCADTRAKAARRVQVVGRIAEDPENVWETGNALLAAAARNGATTPGGALMLDKLEKTCKLIETLKAALPFEVALTPELILDLARHEK